MNRGNLSIGEQRRLDLLDKYPQEILLEISYELLELLKEAVESTDINAKDEIAYKMLSYKAILDEYTKPERKEVQIMVNYVTNNPDNASYVISKTKTISYELYQKLMHNEAEQQKLLDSILTEDEKKGKFSYSIVTFNTVF